LETDHAWLPQRNALARFALENFRIDPGESQFFGPTRLISERVRSPTAQSSPKTASTIRRTKSTISYRWNLVATRETSKSVATADRKRQRKKTRSSSPGCTRSFAADGSREGAKRDYTRLVHGNSAVSLSALSLRNNRRSANRDCPLAECADAASRPYRAGSSGHIRRHGVDTERSRRGQRANVDHHVETVGQFVVREQ